MPVIRVSLWAGRTHEQKAEVAKAITDAMVRITGTKPESTVIIFEDVDKANWASAGILSSDK